MRAAFTKLMVRLPEDIKAFVESEAARNGNSQNSEIIRCIREKMDRLPAEMKTATD
ncbi:Arc family DNA-binding protein [Agrobacterium cavarae]|uniref:Arc family DNA-binding protein n=1 Tax=Agrobacterium cavarae TaxID=2528239 RepID=UPI00289E801B|nr:Arc family DNA-binding protein [Agrobacterium cavarae]